MSLNKKTALGGITISNKAIASVVADASFECYGVVGLAAKTALHEKINELLKRNDFEKGVIVYKTRKSFSIDLYLVIAFDVKITEVLREVQKKVKYVVENKFGITLDAVNVYAQSLKKVD